MLNESTTNDSPCRNKYVSVTFLTHYHMYVFIRILFQAEGYLNFNDFPTMLKLRSVVKVVM